MKPFISSKSWTDRIHWVIYPAFNPDGYVYSWTNYRYQRKNRNPVKASKFNRRKHNLHVKEFNKKIISNSSKVIRLTDAQITRKALI